MPTPTPKRLLIEHLYGPRLAVDVDRFVTEGKSWRTIAALITERTGQAVSYESVRQWFGGERSAA